MRTAWRKRYEKLIDTNRVVALQVPYKQVSRVEHRCLVCNFGDSQPWLLSPYTYLRNPVCPNCAKLKRHKDKTKEYKRKLFRIHGTDITVLGEVSAVLDKVKHRCNVCLTVWFPRPVHTLRGHGCPTCHLKSLRSKSIHQVVLNGAYVEVQGFEDFAIEYLLDRGVPEKGIVVASSGDVPVITYKYLGKKRKHFPDLYLPKQNRLIEVKSTWTFGISDSSNPEWLRRNQLKKKAALKAGFRYTLLIFNDKGQRISLPKTWHLMTKKELKTLL